MKTIEQRIKALETQAQSSVRFAPGGGVAAVARLVVGSGATVQQVSKYTFSLAAVSLAANSTTTQFVTVSGVSLNDWILVNPPSIGNAPLCSFAVNAVNQIQLGFVNPFATAQNTPAGTYTVIAIRA